MQELEQKFLNQQSYSKKLEEGMVHALKKVGGSNENRICRYLPVNGGYMHHFTLRKMKHEQPDALYEMIKKYIINPEKPQTVRPKQRAARGSKKKKDQIILSHNALERVIQLAKKANDLDIIRMLLPKKDLKSIKKELVQCIKKNVINYTLWNSFIEALEGNLAPQ
jgi:hypothetical protein